MWSRLARLSHGQLLLLYWFVQHPKSYATIAELSKNTKLKGKALGGVLSSLSRTKFRGLPLIEPWGRPTEGSGLRWKFNSRLESLVEAKKEVARLLATY
jgi:hypothetical protein